MTYENGVHPNTVPILEGNRIGIEKTAFQGGMMRLIEELTKDTSIQDTKEILYQTNQLGCLITSSPKGKRYSLHFKDRIISFETVVPNKVGLDVILLQEERYGHCHNFAMDYVLYRDHAKIETAYVYHPYLDEKIVHSYVVREDNKIVDLANNLIMERALFEEIYAPSPVINQIEKEELMEIETFFENTNVPTFTALTCVFGKDIVKAYQKCRIFKK